MIGGTEVEAQDTRLARGGFRAAGKSAKQDLEAVLHWDPVTPADPSSVFLKYILDGG